MISDWLKQINIDLWLVFFFRRFYWDKDCRRHVKNIHGIDNYDPEESRQAANINYFSTLKDLKKDDTDDVVNGGEGGSDYLRQDLKTNFLKMKIQMVKCKKKRLNNAEKKKSAMNGDDLNNVESERTNVDPEPGHSDTQLQCSNNNELQKSDENHEKTLEIKPESGEETLVSQNSIGEHDSSEQKKTKIKPFKCQECSRHFLNQKSLKSHLRSCNAPSDSPYSCTLCDRRFLDFEKLQKHWKVNHRRQQMI